MLLRMNIFQMKQGKYERKLLSEDCFKGRYLLTWITSNPSIDKYLYPLCDRTVEVWECISNFIPHFTGHVITYPC